MIAHKWQARGVAETISEYQAMIERSCINFKGIKNKMYTNRS